MGIKNLNRFFLDNCKSIKKIHLDELENKAIAIDISIYLYKYVEKEALIENLYLMVSKFQYYKIRPVFIFDGKPPVEKQELIEKRKQEKNVAEEKYKELKNELDHIQDNQPRIEEIKIEMDILKKQFVRIKSSHIQASKSLFDAMGVFYIECRGEADHLCAYLAKHNYVWACMSDDMDMFLLDCPRVLRHLSLLNDNVMFYDTNSILRELSMNYYDFKHILMVSGTDYNIGDDVPHLYDVVDKYCSYRNNTKKCSGFSDARKCGYFSSWLYGDEQLKVDKKRLDQLYIMYDLSVFALKHNEELREVIKAYPFRNKETKENELARILKEDGFLFVM